MLTKLIDGFYNRLEIAVVKHDARKKAGQSGGDVTADNLKMLEQMLLNVISTGALLDRDLQKSQRILIDIRGLRASVCRRNRKVKK